MKFYFKINLFGPYLFREKTVFRDHFVSIGENNVKSWVEKPDGLDASPSNNLCGITLKKIRVIKNGVEIISEIENNTVSLRKAQRLVEKDLNGLCSILSILISGANYYYEIISAGISPDSIDNNIKEIEGPPSDYLRNISFKRLIFEDSQIPLINQVLEKNETDIEVKKIMKYFYSASESELDSGIGDEKTLINYFKIIEHISNIVFRDLKINKEEKEKQYLELLNKLIINLSSSEVTTDKIKKFRDSAYELRIIDNSVIKEKIISTAKSFNITGDNLKSVYNIVDSRSKMIVHSGEDYIIDEVKAEEFKELAKIFIKKYINNKYNIIFDYFDSQPKAKLFGNRQGYLITAKYLSEHFK